MVRHTASFFWPFFACCAGVALFTGMDASIKALSISTGIFHALLWRAGAECLMGGAMMVLLRRTWPSPAALRIHIKRGVVVSLMAPFFFGVMRPPLAEAISLSFVAPLIALFLAAALLKEHISSSAIIGSVMGLLGVATILSDQLHSDHGMGSLSGAIAILAAAVLFAWNLILQRQQAQLASPIEVAFFQQAVAFAGLTLASAVSHLLIGSLLPTDTYAAAGRGGISSPAQLAPDPHISILWICFTRTDELGVWAGGSTVPHST